MGIGLNIDQVLWVIVIILGVPAAVYSFYKLSYLRRDRKPLISKIIYYPNHKDMKFSISHSTGNGFQVKCVILKEKRNMFFYKRLKCQWEQYGTGNYNKDFFVNDIERISIDEFCFNSSITYKIIVKTSLGIISAIYYNDNI